MSWQYDGRDSGIRLFDAALKAGAPMPLESCRRVLEIGCNEADWLALAHEAWPDIEFVGIDTRAHNATDGKIQRLCRDARKADIFEPASFDAIVSISAIEHIGLGHYRDPKDPDGDSKAMANAWRWLKPGGFMYFDVPYNPERYEVRNTECRIYDDRALHERLWKAFDPMTTARPHGAATWEGYCDSRTPDTLIEKPTKAAERYWYAAHVWQKL